MTPGDFNATFDFPVRFSVFFGDARNHGRMHLE